MSRFKGVVNLSYNNEKIYDNFLVKGIKNSDKIIYKENDINVTIFLKNNKLDMKRETNDYIIKFSFDKYGKTSGSYFLKLESQVLSLNIITKKLYHDNKILEIEYLLYMEEEAVGHFKFSLKEV